MSEAALPRNKMKRAETCLYVRWVMREIVRAPADFAEYNNGRGIIAARERFLVYLASAEGQALLEEARGGRMPADAEPSTSASGDQGPFGKTIIVPVAIPGCGASPLMSAFHTCADHSLRAGKTAVSVALAHIFDFAHTQSDDVRAKRPAPVFMKNVLALLQKNNVVIADKCVLSLPFLSPPFTLQRPFTPRPPPSY
jgi:tRNA ligase